MPYPRNTVSRLLARTEPLRHPDFDLPCRVWTGYKDRDGYGKTTFCGAPRSVHRLVWELTNGPIDADLQIDHRCKRRDCIEVTHLEPVPFRTNWERSDTASAVAFRTNHCRAGHDLAEHGYVNPTTGKRCCRTCKQEWQRERRRR
jgi:hypothetical protein